MHKKHGIQFSKILTINTVQRRHAAGADLTGEDLKHFSVSGTLMSLDCGVRKLQEQTRQALGSILLIGCLGYLPAHVTVRQTNQHHLYMTDQSASGAAHVTVWQTNQHHLYMTDQSASGAAHVTVRQTNQHHLYTTDQSATSTVKHYFHMHQMFAIWVGLRN